MDKLEYLKEAEATLESVKKATEIHIARFPLVPEPEFMVRHVSEAMDEADKAASVIARGYTGLNRIKEREEFWALYDATQIIDDDYRFPNSLIAIQSPKYMVLSNHLNQQRRIIASMKSLKPTDWKYWAECFKEPINKLASLLAVAIGMGISELIRLIYHWLGH